MEKVIIGGGQGFWGDSPDAAIHMVRNSNINYMACDYLAELTLSIMARQKLKNPNAGYARDFLGMMNEVMLDAKNRNIRILTNAGGMNIEGCVAALQKMAREKGVREYKLGYVTGDDMTGKIDDLMKQGVSMDNIDGEVDGISDFSQIKDKIVNANVYFGHEPTLACLEQEADVVVTGRSTDSALFLAPIMHELKWKADDWTQLARGIMVGHLLECGGQGAGGNFDYAWRQVPRMDELGFPIAEISNDDFYITKAPDCGGLISEQSCKEQFLYEVHDPANYVTPDVVVDISKAKITQNGDQRVRVENIFGKQRPDMLKLSIIIMRIMDAISSIPMIILSLFLSAILGKGLFNMCLAIGISMVPTFCRTTRAQTLTVKHADFITAGTLCGASKATITFRHVFPNCVSLNIVSMSMNIGSAIMCESSLSFLGMGINPPTPTWGAMVNEGYIFLSSKPLMAIVPGVCIMVVVLCCNIIGDAVRDALDPKLRGTLGTTKRRRRKKVTNSTCEEA